MRRVRPRLQLTCAASPEGVIQHVSMRLLKSDCPVSGLACKGRIELHVHGKAQHLWSPQLIVDVSEGDHGSLLRGRFGPHPSVWTLYMAGYATCAFGMLLALSFGYAQWVMGTAPWFLLGIPLSGIFALGLYLAAFLGQDAGSAQMTELGKFLEETLGELAETRVIELS